MVSYPVLFIIFNRPDTTRKVFEEIRKQKPKNLYVAADGPREHLNGENEKCVLVREIATLIDWECELRTLFREKNLGCKYAVSSAINWFFEHEEAGIILEDDCLPNSSFFMFCSELLEKYEHNDQIMHITGSNLNDVIKFGDGSYYYSRYAHIWGWATWRRAWKKYDLELQDARFYSRIINSTFKHHSEREFWRSKLEQLKTQSLDTWDYQWMFSIWRENGICLNTNFNLIENIGFGADATHTIGKSNYINSSRKKHLNLIHPSSFEIIEKAEEEFMKLVHFTPRRGYIRYYFNKYFLQRCYNLVYKIKFKMPLTINSMHKWS